MRPDETPKDEQDEVEGKLNAASADAGQESDFDDEDNELVVEDTDDGGAEVDMGEDDEEPDTGFYDNLAFDLPQGLLDSIGLDLCEKIDFDMRSPENADKMYAEGLKRT